MRDLPHANSTRPGCEKYDLPKDRILTPDFEPAVAAKGNPTKVLQDLPDWRLRFRDCKFRRKLGSRGETLVRDIQKLALKLSQERDPRKITELIDEIRDAAATYIDAMPNQRDCQSAADGA